MYTRFTCFDIGMSSPIGTAESTDRMILRMARKRDGRIAGYTHRHPNIAFASGPGLPVREIKVGLGAVKRIKRLNICYHAYHPKCSNAAHDQVLSNGPPVGPQPQGKSLVHNRNTK